MTLKPEMLFVDACVSDIPTILLGLRPEVEAILLDVRRPAARQMAEALRMRSGLEAVHVMAHGAPGTVNFSAGEWSRRTIGVEAQDFATIGRALGAESELRLWSCRTGAGPEGPAFVQDLERATGVDVAAASGLVGAAAKGGEWRLRSRSAGLAGPPPLAETGLAGYSGVLDRYIQIDTKGAPVTLGTGSYSLVAKIDGKTEAIGQFSLLEGHPHNLLIEVSTVRSSFTVYAGRDGNVGDGQIAVYDASGKYSQRATLSVLGGEGVAVPIRSKSKP